MHEGTCIVSQTERSEKTPHLPLGRKAHKSVPHRRAFQVETPRSPIGAFPVFRLPYRGAAPGA